MSRRTAQEGPSSRQLRVGEELRHALARIIERGELRDPGLAGVSITVSEVRASPDLKRASVFVMPLGGRDIEPVVEALGRAAAYIRRLVAREVQLRYAPELVFKADPSFAEASRIAALLRDAGAGHGDDGANGGDATADDGGHDDKAADDPAAGRTGVRGGAGRGP